MDNHKKLFEGLLKADGINPAGVTESERTAFAKMLDRQLKSKPSKPEAMFFRPDIWRIIKFAAAAIVVISAVCWLAVSDRGELKQQDTNRQVVAVKSQTAAEMMTLSSLRIALHNGGTEAVEKQFNKAFKMIGPRPSNLSDSDLQKIFKLN